MQQSVAGPIGAVTFLWLGMVLAISFIEAPLKFRAPGVTIPIGLGIGRLVFRALNVAETVLAVLLLVLVFGGVPPVAVTTIAVACVLVLVVQLAFIRPGLNRRSDRVLAAPDDAPPPRSRAHLVYIAAELVKVLALVALGILTLTG